MKFATIFIAVLGFEYLWWMLACRRNRRLRRQKVTESLRHYVAGVGK